MMKYYDLNKIETKQELELNNLNITKEPFIEITTLNQAPKTHKKIIILNSDNHQTLLKASMKGIIDIITHTTEIDKTLLKEMTKTNTTLNLPLSKILEKTKNNDYYLNEKNLIDYKKIIKNIKKTKTPLIISSYATHENQLTPLDGLISFAEFIGLNKKQARESLNLVHEKLLKRIK